MLGASCLLAATPLAGGQLSLRRIFKSCSTDISSRGWRFSLATLPRASASLTGLGTYVSSGKPAMSAKVHRSLSTSIAAATAAVTAAEAADENEKSDKSREAVALRWCHPDADICAIRAMRDGLVVAAMLRMLIQTFCAVCQYQFPHVPTIERVQNMIAIMVSLYGTVKICNPWHRHPMPKLPKVYETTHAKPPPYTGLKLMAGFYVRLGLYFLWFIICFICLGGVGHSA